MEQSLVVAYLPEPQEHPLWNEIVKLLEPAMLDGAQVIDTEELVWIAFEGTTLFGAGTTALLEGDEQAIILACGGFRHRDWIEQAKAVVSAWARDCGAKTLIMRGRRGWARYFAGWDVSGPDDDWRWTFKKDLQG